MNSIVRALNKYSSKQIKSTNKPMRKKNTKPEKEVEKAVTRWLKDNGFSCNVVDSKAVYSTSSGRYMNGKTDMGFSDIVGCTPNGLAVYIELKAKGKRSTLKIHQYDFLLNKINHGAFAVCVDSVDCLVDIVSKFRHCSYENRIKLLTDHLPKKKRDRVEPKSFLD